MYSQKAKKRHAKGRHPPHPREQVVMSEPSAHIEMQPPDYLQMTSSLALELAQGLSMPSEVFSRYGIEPGDALKLLRSEDFQAMLKM